MESNIKSKSRIRDFGEVFTNEREVKDMLDLIPDFSIDTTVLEPTCGNGNFIVEIFRRKFDLCKNKKDFIKCFTTVYGIDLLEDNVKECKERVVELLKEYEIGKKLDDRDYRFILDSNIFHGNSLAIMKLLEDDGKVVYVTSLSKEG